jgi:hypothetical protein
MSCLPSPVSQWGHAVSLGGSDLGRVAVWPDPPESASSCRTQGKMEEVHNPEYRATAVECDPVS